MRAGSRLITILSTAIAAVAAAVVLAAPASAATRCGGSFQVLHDDHVGALSLPAGPYGITANGISCAAASKLLTQFLQDYDGHLPRPWVVNASRRSFTRGTGSTGFTLTRGRFPPAPPSPPTPSRPGVCPATFTVLHNDRIGSVSFPRGQYTTSLLTTGVSCQQASTLFAAFLDDVDGRLGDGWTVAPLADGAGGVFTNADTMVSFQQRLTGGGRTGGGGHSHQDATFCGPFRVLHDDHIGSLYLPRGSYDVSTLANDTLTCAQATRQFTRFLDLAKLPSPWVLDAATGTFTRGANSAAGFRIKPAARGLFT